MNKEKNNLNLNWVSGFVDAEGNFYIRIYKSNTHNVSWRVQACFQIGLHFRDKDLLLQIKSFFNEVGNTYKVNNKAINY